MKRIKTTSTGDTGSIILTINSKEATVFGKKVVNDVPPVIRNERTMLPIRFVVENLGGKIEWNSVERKATITKDNKVIEIYIGQQYAYLNGTAFLLDSPAFIEGDRTYLPLRFVAENLDAKVTWDASTKKVTIIPIA